MNSAGERLPRRAADFPAAARLRAQAEFEVVFKTGRKVVTRELVAWMRPVPPGASRSRLGLSVGRRVGGAVQRNRTKRLLRDAFRHLSHTLPEPHDVVLVPRPANLTRTAEETRRALQAVFERLARGESARPRKRRSNRSSRAGPGSKPPGDKPA